MEGQLCVLDCDPGFHLDSGSCAPNFSLHENGVTVLCDAASVGETGTVAVGGVRYTKRPRWQITLTNAHTACTSGITDMSSLFQSDLYTE